jgi:predicted TPR repeat methyltransferase
MKQGLPPTQQRALVHAAQLRAKGKLADAEATLRKLLKSDARFQRAVHLLGLVRFERGDAVEAKKLLEKAVSLEANDVDAWRNLGNICQDSGAPERAIACFRCVLDLQPGDIAARGNLALLIQEAGNLTEAAAELRTLLKFAPGEETALRMLSRVLRSLRQYEEEVNVIRELLRRFPHDANLKTELSRSYFLWFDSVDREAEKAKVVLAEWYAFDPQDPICLHMRASFAVGDEPLRATDRYVERHFDEFAQSFDEVLTNLQYSGPTLMKQALEAAEPNPRGVHATVDLGCGTGLGGALIKPWASSLVGVDLSQKMLDLAKKRGVYNELVHEELTAFVLARPGAFDLAICMETLLYFGDWDVLFAAVARSLRPGGRFIFTAELLEDGDKEYALLTSGRYAHRQSYVCDALKKAGFVVERNEIVELRKHYGEIVKGVIATGRV